MESAANQNGLSPGDVGVPYSGDIGPVLLYFGALSRYTRFPGRDTVRSLMLALRLLPPQLILPARTLGLQGHPRWLHDAKRGWARWEGETSPVDQNFNQEDQKHQEHKSCEPKVRGFRRQAPKNQKPRHQEPKDQEPRYQEPKQHELSLFEELFPEEVKKHTNLGDKAGNTEQRIPRLPLPDLDATDDEDGYILGQGRAIGHTESASRAAFRQWNIAVLIIQRASKSLIESDFRRIAPKGQHIEDWKGPGDPLKVIPGRDQSTLQPLGHYFLLFPNPTYARAYQNYVVHTHRLATTHTPTSLESSMAPPKGMTIEGEDVYALLQDYALCPPSQKISLKVLFSPYSPAVKKMIDQRGYAQLVSPEEKGGRSVLFWVNGHQPQTNLVRNVIAQDGRDRGMEWALLNGRKSIEKVDVPTIPGDVEDLEDSSLEEVEGGNEPVNGRRPYPRWVITFEDENEARRFVRAWHRRLFSVSRDPSLQDEPPPLVHAEFLW